MNNIMNKFFKSSLITSILLLVLGGLLIFESEATIVSISYIIGGILIALGIVALISYIRNKRSIANTDLDIIYGIVTIILGTLIITHPKALASIMPFVLGISIVISSAGKVQTALELKKTENDAWVMTIIVALLSTICGLILIFNPFAGATMIMQVVGIFIIIYAILDIISTLTIKKNISSIQKEIKKSNIKDAEIIEEDDVEDDKAKK